MSLKRKSLTKLSKINMNNKQSLHQKILQIGIQESLKLEKKTNKSADQML
jgi:hypothetical protein